MQIEHITLGGNSTLRDTNQILPETIRLLKAFQINEGHALLEIPRTKLSSKVTVSPPVAMFDVLEGNVPFVTNVCSLRSEGNKAGYEIVQKIAKSLGRGEARLPVMDNWIYSIPINPFASPDSFELAGEIELYIYYSIFLGQK